MKITTVISACSLDAKFLPALFREVMPLSAEILVSVCPQRFDGTPEPEGFVDKLRRATEGVANVIEFGWDPSQTQRWHHNQARWVATEAASSPWMLYLDADEVPDGAALGDWLAAADRCDICCASFRCYWYFRSPAFRATTQERCGLLVSRDRCHKRRFFTENERYYFAQIPGYLGSVLSLDAYPMFHHYSWVHGKDEMLSKVSSWGHAKDKDWRALVEAEFQREFSPERGDKDFIHGYTFERVKPFAEIRGYAC